MRNLKIIFVYIFFNLFFFSCSFDIINKTDLKKEDTNDKNGIAPDLSSYYTYEHGLKINIGSLVFSHDGNYIAIGGDSGEVIVYDIAAKKATKTSISGKGKIEALVFNSDDRALFTYSYDGNKGILYLTKFNIKNSTKTEIFSSKNIHGSHGFFSLSGKYLSYWSRGFSKTQVYTIYDLSNEQIIKELNYKDELLFFNANEKSLIGLKNFNVFESIDINSNTVTKDFNNKYNILTRRSVATNYSDLIAAGTTYGNNDDDAIIIYSLAENKLVHLIHIGDNKLITSLAFSPNARFLVSSNRGSSPERIKMWDVQSGALIKALALNPDEKIAPGGLAFIPNGIYFEALGPKTLFIWLSQPKS